MAGAEAGNGVRIAWQLRSGREHAE